MTLDTFVHILHTFQRFYFNLGHGNENHRFWSPRASPQGYRIKNSLFGQIFHYFENLAIFLEIKKKKFQDNLIVFVLKMIGIAWAFQKCYSFTIYSISTLKWSFMYIKMMHSKNRRKTWIFKNFQNMSYKTPQKK